MQCTRILAWDMGHRVLNHEGKCARLHGHRYEAHVTCSGALDQIGRVIDFGVIKAVLGCWVDETWDHRTMINSEDTELAVLASEHLVVVDFNPTAENIAQALLDKAAELLAEFGVVVEHVRVFETPNCYADVSNG